MSINTTLAGLSTNPALNGPDGAVDPPSALDDQQRYHGSFIAQLRDGTGFSAGAAVAALGFTPVQQGTGGSQLPNTVKIGWSAANFLRVQVDASDFGVNWPINVTGNAATATNATNAATAANASALGGVAPTGYVKSTTGNVVALTWDGTNGWVYSSVDGSPQSAYTLWEKIPNRPTDLSQFGNGPGYATVGYTDGSYLKRESAALSLGNIGTGGLYVNISGFGAVSWGVTPSDRRLKTDIAPSTEDSLSKIAKIDFKQFRFRQDVTETPVDDGRLHRLGVIAQDLEDIDPAWLQEGGTWKAPNQQALLYAALHAIKQLEAKVATLEARA